MRAMGNSPLPQGFAQPHQWPCSTSQADDSLAAAAISTRLSSLMLISMLGGVFSALYINHNSVNLIQLLEPEVTPHQKLIV